MKKIRFYILSFFFSLSWRLYVSWSTFYRWAFEDDLIHQGKEVWDLKIDPVISVARTDLYRGGSHDTTWTHVDPHFFWHEICKNLVKYHRDRWYMGFDVCSHPLAFLGRGEGDCDDFAALGREIFGWRMTIKRKSYYFTGFYSLFYVGPKFGHMVATWTASDGQMLVVNGRILETYISFDAFKLAYSTGKDYKKPTSKLWAVGCFNAGNGYSPARFEFSEVLMVNGEWWSSVR